MAFALPFCVGSLVSAAVPSGGALAGDRPRVIVSTDVGGGDPDDFQSMVHLLMYADVLDLEGLISSPPKQGRARDLHECLDAYAKDYAKLKAVSGRFPPPQALRALVRQGATDPAPARGFAQPTEGSDWIIECAKHQDQRPLWILVWGSLTDVAQAVHDDPAIKNRIRIYSIGSWNTRNDRAARDYLFEHHPDLWWIESDTTFRGMYLGGNQQGDLGNRTFVERHVKGHGALGDFFHAKKPDIKMGDSPSLLYLLRGDPDDPTQPSWGGSYPALLTRNLVRSAPAREGGPTQASLLQHINFTVCLRPVSGLPRQNTRCTGVLSALSPTPSRGAGGFLTWLVRNPGYVRHPDRPRFWHDDPRPSQRDANRDGARTVNRWREDYLRDWQRRMDWLQ